ncbi:MAG TPA: carbon monoxide dehydrogenase subunit G [Solirubrobacteraceae bacterium]|nr:carbon monoxide dehydrogenase subunit G [Solirubrobacteraceae bacterium]
MKITGEHDFVAPREDVWNGLHDPQVLAATMPGAHRLDPTGPNEYTITVSVGVGSVKGNYDGVFAVTDTTDGEACTVRATASGRPGSVETVAQMQLTDGDGGAHMVYEAEATVTGPLAGVGQRLMAAAARRTTEQFLSALDAHLISPPAAEEAAAAAEPARAIERARPAPQGKIIVASALAGGLLALLGVIVGRWTARR